MDLENVDMELFWDEFVISLKNMSEDVRAHEATYPEFTIQRLHCYVINARLGDQKHVISEIWEDLGLIKFDRFRNTPGFKMPIWKVANES